MSKTQTPAKPLNSLERTTLRNSEATIREHVGSFVKVGTALAAIKSQCLYREDYATFEAYLKGRWDFEKRHAYRLIDASAVVENVSHGTQTRPNLPDNLPKPTNERQARPLTELPPEDQPKAWKAAVEKAEELGKPVTAAIVAEVVEEMKGEAEEDEIVPVTPQKPDPVKDAKGKKIPTDLLDSWQETEKQFDSWSRELQAILRNVKEFAATKEGAWLDVLTFGRDIANCKHALKFAKPYVVCHVCKGDGCDTCRKTGWLPQTTLTRNAQTEEVA